MPKLLPGLPGRRVPRKLPIVLAAVFTLFGVSAAAAYFVADRLFQDDTPVYGLDCRIVGERDLHRGGERWYRVFARVGPSTGEERMTTALRLARHAASQHDSDIYLVLVLDENGPAERAHFRGRAVGARLIHAPHPERLRGLRAPFQATLIEGEAGPDGLFYGARSVPDPDTLAARAARMEEPFGCQALEDDAHGAPAKTAKAGH